MNALRRRYARVLTLLFLISLSPIGTFAQTAMGSLRGQVTDPSGAVIPGATVTITGAQGTPKVAKTNGEGQYVIHELPPGKYTVQVAAAGFVLYENMDFEIKSGPQTLDIKMTVSAAKEEVTVTDTATRVDVDPSSNLGALVLKEADLEALSDNPDDLAADLQALAGPAVGPNGGQIFIDGFTGGRLPPKESIREVRINQNPFSAEFDRVGFGRIEILTKPGTDKFRGQVFFNFGDSALNSRNPFAPNKPSYQSKHFSSHLSGPINKKSSFFVDADRRDVDETAVVSALTLDPLLNITPFSQAVLTPTKRTSFSPRIDYQLTQANTLVARYTYAQMTQRNEGIGEFSLPSRGYNVDNTQQTLQLTETAVLSAKAINETRFQYIRQRNNQAGDNSQPTIRVLDAFTGGGSGVGLAYSNEDHYELQNYTSLIVNKHMLKLGGRLRDVRQSDLSTQNYNSTFTFTSLAAYRTTLQGLRNGLTLPQIRALGGGASQFSIIGGDPLASISQFDLGLFAQDDWRIRPNFMLSLGLRYETQNNISDHLDVAPRLGFAWGIGRGKTNQPKTVIRGGFGLFYDRFSENLTLQARRLNGIAQQQYLVAFPSFYPDIPPLETLAENRRAQTIRRVDANLRAPYIAQTAIGVERQLPKNIMVSLTYTNSRGLHALRSRNINAPLPGTYNPQVPNSGVRPFGDIGNIYVYESSGRFDQNQLIVNVNARVSPRLTLFGFYTLNRARSDTDGAGSFPSNQYDLSTEYGRAVFDVRHRAFIGGSIETLFGIRVNPFITASSGRPFNITIGRDLNGDSLFNARPAFATDLSRASVVYTPYGVFDTNPLPGQAIIPRNYGDGPGQFSVNLRVSRTFGFGERSTSARGPSGAGGRLERGPHGGPPGGAGGAGGPRGDVGGAGRGPGGIFVFGKGAATRRYSLTFSASARNLFNRVNFAPPIGNLSSPLFGTSNAIASGFGGTATANRRLELQLRFSF